MDRRSFIKLGLLAPLAAFIPKSVFGWLKPTTRWVPPPKYTEEMFLADFDTFVRNAPSDSVLSHVVERKLAECIDLFAHMFRVEFEFNERRLYSGSIVHVDEVGKHPLDFWRTYIAGLSLEVGKAVGVV